jgi:hypothetical protein
MIFFVAQEHRIIGQSAAPPLLLVTVLFWTCALRWLDLKLKVPGCLPQIHGTLQEAAVSIYFYPKWWTVPPAIRRRHLGRVWFLSSARPGRQARLRPATARLQSAVAVVWFNCTKWSKLCGGSLTTHSFPLLSPLWHFVDHMHGDHGKKDKKATSGKKSRHGEANSHPFSVFLARLPPTRLSACTVSLFGYVHIQSQARESRRLVACTR